MNEKVTVPPEVKAISKEEIEAMSQDQIKQALYDLQVHQIELAMQNDELLRIQTELDISRNRYFELYDFAPVSYLTITGKGLILEANLTASLLLKIPRNVLINQPISRFILSEDQDIFYMHIHQLIKINQEQSFELRMTQSDKKEFWAHIRATFNPEADKVNCYRIIVSDITQRIEYEISTQKLYFDMYNQKKELDTLFNIAKSVIHQSDFNEIAKGIFTTGIQMIKANCGYIELFATKESKREFLILDSGSHPQDLEDDNQWPLKNFSQELMVIQPVILENEIQTSLWGDYLPRSRWRLDNALIAPLIIKEQAVGVVVIGDKSGGFVQADNGIVKILAEMVSIALRNDRDKSALIAKHPKKRTRI